MFRVYFNWQNRSNKDFIQSSLKWETFYCLSKLLLIQRTSVKLLISIPRLIQNLSSHFKKTVKLGSGRLFSCLMFNVCKFFNLEKTLSFLPDGILFVQSNKTWGIEICGIGRGSGTNFSIKLTWISVSLTHFPMDSKNVWILSNLKNLCVFIRFFVSILYSQT